jgi:hypothetical protein
MNNKSTKDGISLIILVITIIVIIVLAGAVILSLSQNNPINSATEATFKATIDTYKSDLAMSISSKYVQDQTFNPSRVYAGTWDGNDLNKLNTVKEYVPTISAIDGQKYIIQDGKLVYIGSKTTEKLWSIDVGVSDPYIKDGLILWLQGDDFKNNPATTTWKDRSGNGNDATVANFSYTSISGNNGNGGVAFDGVNDNIYVSKNSIFTQLSMTIELYIIPHDKGSRQCLFTYWYGFTTEINADGTFKFGLQGLSGQYYGSKKVIWDKPIHIVSTYDDTTKVQKIYFDGVFQEQQTITGAITYDNTFAYFSGAWDRAKVDLIACRFYNRALTSSEILQNYKASL